MGTQLKGYVIGEKLGQGGFGITYRGFDVTLKMKVAIKEYYPSEFVGRSTNRKTVVLNAHEHEELFHYGLRTFLDSAVTRYEPKGRCIGCGRQRGRRRCFWHSVSRCHASV